MSPNVTSSPFVEKIHEVGQFFTTVPIDESPKVHRPKKVVNEEKDEIPTPGIPQLVTLGVISPSRSPGRIRHLRGIKLILLQPKEHGKIGRHLSFFQVKMDKKWIKMNKNEVSGWVNQWMILQLRLVVY